MRKHLSGWAASALVVATLAYMVGVAVSGHSAVTPAPGFSGFATATPIHVDALQASATSRLADIEVAFSGAATNSAGFAPTSIQNEMQINIQPNNTASTPPAAFPGKNASGRGSGIEIGVNNPLPSQVRTIVQADEAEAVAPPNTDIVTKQVLGPTIPTNQVVYASLLRGQAQAVFEPNPCLANPIAMGLGYIADAQLLNSGTGAGPDGRMTAPVLATDDPNPERAVTQSRSVVFPVANGDGTFGLVSETRSTFAPINIARGGPSPAPKVIIEILGEWIFRATATGKGPGTIEQTVRMPTGEAPTPTTTVIRISTNGGTSFTDITFQQLPAFGATGFVIPAPLSPVISGAIGEDARAIAAPGAVPDPLSTPTKTDTTAAGAADVLRIQVLAGAPSPAPAGAHAADLRIGHQEASVSVPPGGFRCQQVEETTTTTDGPATTTSTTAPATTTSAPAATTTSRPAVSPSTTQRPADPPPPAPPARPVVVSPSFVG